jgi:hypothetical protein
MSGYCKKCGWQACICRELIGLSEYSSAEYMIMDIYGTMFPECCSVDIQQAYKKIKKK